MSVLHASAAVGAAMAGQYLPTRTLERLQLSKLRRMIEHCQREVPFYRDLWREAGIDARSLRTLADLRRFPIPSRRAIEEAPERIVARSFLGLYRSGRAAIRRSGGSSGGPRLSIHADPKSWRALDGFYFRALASVGYRPWEPLAYFWSAPLPPPRAGLMPKISVPAHLDEEAQMLVLEQNPGIWWYYHPSSLFALARRYPDRLRGARPKGVICHAELLTDSMREVIERALGRPVFDQYGTSELNRMAWQCPERAGYHVDADSYVLEVLDEQGRPVPPGEVGRAVVTGLVNRMMPLVRYELGDLLVPSDRRCPCGRTLPMIERIEGRAADAVRLPDGRRLTPRQLLEPFAGVQGVEQFRLTFEGAAAAVFTLVTVPGADAARAEREVRGRFEAAYPGVALRVERVAALRKAPTGKRVMVRNAAPTDARFTM